MEKVGGVMEERWRLEILCTSTHTCAGSSLRATLRVGTGAEERLAAGFLGAGRVGRWGGGPGGRAGWVGGGWQAGVGWVGGG